jgi:hypothetical protein
MVKLYPGPVRLRLQSGLQIREPAQTVLGAGASNVDRRDTRFLHHQPARRKRIREDTAVPSRRSSPLGRRPGAAESPSYHSRHRGSHVRPKEPTVGAHSAYGHRLRRARDRCVCPLFCASLRSVLCMFRGTSRFPSADAVRAVRQPLN